MPPKDVSSKDDSNKENKEEWTRQHKIGIVIVIIGLVGAFCGLQSNFNIIGNINSFGEELQYKDSCGSFKENSIDQLYNFEGNRVKCTGIILKTIQSNDIRLIFLKKVDSTSDTEISCVITDLNERKGEEGDLITAYGFLYGTHLSSKGKYSIPLIIGKYIDIKEKKYA